MTIRTAILEARYLLGDRGLYDELLARFDKEVVRGTAAEFVAAKLAEREERIRRTGQSRYLVEPNVKDGKGGLRDLHTLFWIAKYVYRVREPEELVEQGVFDRAEVRLFERCENFLWAVRCHMHFLAGRAEERLSFDIQRSIAQRLGYSQRPGLRDVERFMKHYFLTAKDVGDLTAILCAALESRQAKPVPMLNRVVAKLRPRGRRVLRESDDFVIDNARINIADDDVFARDPVNLIRMFRLAQRHGLSFHPDALRRATHSLKLVDKSLRENEEANLLFREILTSKSNAEIVLRRMNEAGVLGRFVPEFGQVVSMMQFNMYHHYTVDEHLLRCIGDAGGDRGRHQSRLCARQRSHAQDPSQSPGRALLRAVPPRHRQGPRRGSFDRRRADRAPHRPSLRLLGGGHRDHGVARRAPPRDVDHRPVARPLRPQDHRELLLDRAVAGAHEAPDHPHHRRHPRRRPRGVERMEGAAPPRALLRDRAVAHRRLLRGRSLKAAHDGAGRVPRRGQGLAGERDRPIHRVAITRPTGSRSTSRARSRTHSSSAPPKQEGKALSTQVRLDPSRGVTVVSVLAPDHPRLLSVIAGACAVIGANIVDAQIYTTTDGMALDTIAFTREFPEDADEARRADRIAAAMENALRGDLRLPDVVAKRATPKGRIRAFAIEPEVTINNQWSNRYTVVEVSGLDRPGLLYELTATLSKLNLNIASAHVATFGERAVDVFYVTDLMGAMISTPTRNAAIKRALIQVFTPQQEARQRVVAAQ